MFLNSPSEFYKLSRNVNLMAAYNVLTLSVKRRNPFRQTRDFNNFDGCPCAWLYSLSP